MLTEYHPLYNSVWKCVAGPYEANYVRENVILETLG